MTTTQLVGRRPFVKLFTLTAGGRLPERHLTDEGLRFIAETYGWINSHGGSWRFPAVPAEMPFGRGGGAGRLRPQGRSPGDRARAVNPGLILTNYCNGSYTNQDGVREAMLAERQIPLAIAVHDTGARLAGALGADETAIRLRPPPARPDGQPPTFPFIASRTEQEHTRDKWRFVAWLRLDDEILRIDQVEATPEGQIELRVRRGWWGTGAAAHGGHAVVLQPVYCGTRRPDGGEYSLSGLPGGPSPQVGLRYVFMQQRQEVWRFLAERMQETLDEGLSGPWFDTDVSSWINHADACGGRVAAPYDVDLGRPLDRETYREYQQRKHDYLFEHSPGAEIYVNWFFPRHYWAQGPAAPAGGPPGAQSGGPYPDAGGHERLLFSGENGHRPVTGGAIEMYANERYMDWHDLLRMHLDMRDSRFRVVSWAKRADAGARSDADMPAEYQLFAYATHLLVDEPHSELYWGGAWGPGGEQGSFTPPPFVYWDLGAALERLTSVEQAAVPQAPGLYRRRFSRGQVLVNPSADTEATLPLGASHFDPLSGRSTDSVTLPPQRAALLLRE